MENYTHYSMKPFQLFLLAGRKGSRMDVVLGSLATGQAIFYSDTIIASTMTTNVSELHSIIAGLGGTGTSTEGLI